MIGGKVIEVCNVPNRPSVLWVNVADRPYTKIETCSVLVEISEESLEIQIGDSIWWQCGKCYWTPQDSKKEKQGKDFDIVLKKVGYSGATYESVCKQETKQ